MRKEEEEGRGRESGKRRTLVKTVEEESKEFLRIVLFVSVLMMSKHVKRSSVNWTRNKRKDEGRKLTKAGANLTIDFCSSERNT